MLQKCLKGLAIALGGYLIITFGFSFVFDANKYRDLLSQKLGQSTKSIIEIDDLKVKIWGSPKVTLQGLRFLPLNKNSQISNTWFTAYQVELSIPFLRLFTLPIRALMMGGKEFAKRPPIDVSVEHGEFHIEGKNQIDSLKHLTLKVDDLSKSNEVHLSFANNVGVRHKGKNIFYGNMTNALIIKPQFENGKFKFATIKGNLDLTELTLLFPPYVHKVAGHKWFAQLEAKATAQRIEIQKLGFERGKSQVFFKGYADIANKNNPQFDLTFSMAPFHLPDFKDWIHGSENVAGKITSELRAWGPLKGLNLSLKTEIQAENFRPQTFPKPIKKLHTKWEGQFNLATNEGWFEVPHWEFKNPNFNENTTLTFRKGKLSGIRSLVSLEKLKSFKTKAHVHAKTLALDEVTVTYHDSPAKYSGKGVFYTNHAFQVDGHLKLPKRKPIALQLFHNIYDPQVKYLP